MANRDLLKEAIADAKALKETAIANAKAALEEAFEPKLKSMLSAKLEEMEKEEELEEAEMTEAKEKVEEKSDRKDGGEDKETKRTEKMKYGKDLAEAEDMDEEMDLDEILAELEEGDDKEDMNEAEEEIDEAEEKEEEDVEVDAEEEDSEEGEDEDEEIDLEDMSEEDLKSFIEDVIADMVEAGELEAGEEFEAEDEMDSEEEIDIDVEDEAEEIMEGEKEEVNEETIDENLMLDLAKALADSGMVEPANAMTAVKAAVAGVPALATALGLGRAAYLDKKDAKSMGEAEMEDMMEEVNALRAELHEVNLLNAKLLYANKIFRAKNLKEAQKVKVLEAFDKASNVSEVKLVFETLSSEVKETKTIVKENLGSASKPAGVAPTKAPIVEVDPQVARWQKLAGLR